MAKTTTAKPLHSSLAQFDALPDSAHVQVRTVASVVGVSTATVWRMTQKGTLPPPKKLSQRCSRWNVGELRRALGG
jgi:predicted DNA-binding transcriptional regulator AlpA